MEKKFIRTKENFRQLGEVLKLLLPQGKQECILFAGFFVFYFSYSILLVFNTSVIDNQHLIYDVYFSFDNPIIYNKGYVYMEGHPLMVYFTYPFLLLGNCLGTFLGYKAKTVLLVLLCLFFISMSVVYVYRYLKEIVKVEGFALSLFVLFYGFFSTSLILCFTPESFTVTAFLLSFTIYYYAHCMQQGKGVRLLTNGFFAIGLGGITVTNFAKGIVPMLFAKESRKTIVRKIIIVGVVFGLCILWIQYKYDFISQIKFRLDSNISLPSRGVYYEKIIDMLFCGPILMPGIFLDSIRVYGLMETVISVDYYRHWWQYAFALTLFATLAYSVVKNYKNKYVQVLLLMLSVDIVIHAIIRYGLRDSFIYGGHWVFIVPMLLGWLYSTLKELRYRKIMLVVVSVLFVVMLVNNIYQLVDFVNLSIENFPPHPESEVDLWKTYDATYN
ncbi:DUF6080 domain-containing protein [Dysgonomonas sp. 520]|uniref:DUF6080 domain-containing protein n=1 Tax=Dysgonomonas sp. 520 TaxID=2302931 RepID=UPI0013D8677E|nr:DUF6080 domain-containing protein [Dysgonomonas sp. 520]